MKKLGKFYNVFFDIFELYAPMAAFIYIFIAYVVMIVYRYIFHAQIAWLYESSLLTFVWLALFSAAYGSRKDTHVTFTLVYDKLSHKGQFIFRLIGNIIIAVLYAISLPASYNYVKFMSYKPDSILGISFFIIYFPILIYIPLTIIHHIVLLVSEFSKQDKQ